MLLKMCLRTASSLKKTAAFFSSSPSEDSRSCRLSRIWKLSDFSFKAKLLITFFSIQNKILLFSDCLPILVRATEKCSRAYINLSKSRRESAICFQLKTASTFSTSVMGVPESNCFFDSLYKSAHGFLHFSYMIRQLQFVLPNCWIVNNSLKLSIALPLM